MNILYASSRGWNVGDDFIRTGCENVLEVFFPMHNRLLYDKSHHVRQDDGRVREPGDFHGNSFDPARHRGQVPLDMVCFCGTPYETGPVPEAVFGLGAPVLGISLGAQPSCYTGQSLARWRQARVITVRDKSFLSPYRSLFGDRVLYLPCASLLSAPERMRRRVQSPCRIALGWKCDRKRGGILHNTVSSGERDTIADLYRRLMAARPELEYVIVVHHVNELRDAMDEFPGLDVRCSYDERRYPLIYSDCDYVVTPRVHGVGVCASMGIPGALLPTDWRAGSAEGFLAVSAWELDAILRGIDSCAETSDRLWTHRDATFTKYLELIAGVVEKPGEPGAPAASFGPKAYSFFTHKHLGDALICAGAVRNVVAAHPEIRFVVPDHCGEAYANNPDFVEKRDAGSIVPIVGRVEYGSVNAERHGERGTCVEGFTRCLCELMGIEQVPIITDHPVAVLSDDELEEAKKWEGAILLNANCQTCTVSKGYPHWQAVVDGLAGHRVIQIGGKEDRDLSPDLKGVEDMRGRTTIRQLFAMAYGCRMVIAPPTSLTNIAGAFCKPQIVVNASREADVLTGYPNAVHISTKFEPCGWGVTDGCVALWWDRSRKCDHPIEINGRKWSACQVAVDPQRIIDAALEILGR